jgi:pimeloyl-ACP methyl ester carboxylesterase
MEESDRVPSGWIEGSVRSNEIDLHYVRSGGDGPPIVVSHGVFDDGVCRLPLARALDDAYDVILYDARGHGRSDAPRDGYNAETMATDLLGLVDGLDLDDPVLLGHSMGGDAVATAAAREPGLPRAVVLVEPAGLMYRNQDEADVGTTAADARELIEGWQAGTKADLLETDESLRRLVEEGREELASLLADARLRVSPKVTQLFDAVLADPDELYHRIEVPTLVLRGDIDRTARERDAELVDPLRAFRLVHLNGADHTVFRDTRANATRELRAFLRDLDAG